MNPFAMAPLILIPLVYLILIVAFLYVVYRMIDRWVMLMFHVKKEQNELLREIIKAFSEKGIK